MNNILNLTKINFKDSIGSLFAKFNKKRKIKSYVALIIVTMLFLIFSINMGIMFFSYGEILKTINMQNYILYYGIIYYILLCMIFLSYQTQDLFFKTKDYNLLASMPIKSHQIIISKFLSLLLMSYFFEICVLFPAVIIYYMFVNITLLSVLYMLVTFLLLPVFNLFFSSIVVLVINLLSSRAKNKNKANLMYIFIFMFIIIGIFLFVNYFGLNSLMASGGITTVLHLFFPTASLMFYAINGVNFWYFISCVLLNFVLLFASVMLLSRFYHKVNKNFQNKSTHSKKIGGFKENSVLKNLTIIEIKSYFSKPIYVFNTAFGMIILTIFSIAFPIYFLINSQVIMSPSSQFSMFFTGEFKLLIFALLPTSIMLLSPTTNCAISLEGVSIYHKKSMPIKFKDIVLSKIFVNLLVSLPIVLYFLTFLPIMIYLSFSFWEILLVIASPISALFFVSFSGLMINLWFPKLNWTNVTVVVKQSLSTFISIMLSMFIFLLFFILYTQVVIPVYLFLILIISTFVVLGIVFAFLIKQFGEKIYNRL